MTPDYGIFWAILKQLEGVLRTGAANLQPQLQFWLTILLAWEVVRVAWQGLRGGLAWSAAECVLRTGVIVWGLTYYPEFCQRIMNTMIRIGLGVGLGFVDVATFLDPGSWWKLSDAAAAPLYEAYRASSLFSGQTFLLLMVWLAYKASFIAIAIGIFAAQVQALIGTLISLVTLPTLAFRGTAWIGSQAIARAVNHGVKLMAWAIVGGLAYTLAKSIVLTGQIDVHLALIATAGVWCITILAFVAQRAAAEALGGMASAGIGSGVKWMAATVGTGLAVATGGSALGARVLAGAATTTRIGYAGTQATIGQIRTGFAAGNSLTGIARTRAAAQQWRKSYRQTNQGQGMQRLQGFATGARRISGQQYARMTRRRADLTRLGLDGHEGHGGVRQ